MGKIEETDPAIKKFILTQWRKSFIENAFYFWNRFRYENSKSHKINIDLQKKVNFKMIAVASLSINILALGMPIMMLQTYDRILPTKGIPTLTLLVIGLSIALIFEVIIKVIRSYITGQAGMVFEHSTACMAMNNLLSAEFQEIENTGAGTFLKRMQAIGRLRGFYSGQALMTIIDLPFTFIFLAVIWYIAGSLVLVPVILIIIFTIFVYLVGSKIKINTAERDQFIDFKTDVLVQVLEGIHSVKSLGSEIFFIRKNELLRSQLSRLHFNISNGNNLISNFGQTLSQLMTVFIVLFGCIIVYHGELGMGGLAAIVLLGGRVMGPVQKALGLWTRFQEFSVAQDQVKELFNYTIQEKLPFPEDFKNEGTLELKNVSYYIERETLVPIVPNEEEEEKEAEGEGGEEIVEVKGEEEIDEDNKKDSKTKKVEIKYRPEIETIKVVDNISLTIKRGEAIAISSSKGLGKTLLMSVIAGFYKPQEGEVLLDGYNINNMDPDKLYEMIGFVSEVGEILNGTVKENLNFFGKIKTEDAMEAAEIFKIDEAIAVLPDGWNTMLHNSPADLLPPGLKQRICICRVLASHPSILIFDHADVNLDNEGYRKLFEIFGKIKKNLAIIMVTEDRNFIELCDREYHFENGQLFEYSEHEDGHRDLKMG